MPVFIKCKRRVRRSVGEGDDEGGGGGGGGGGGARPEGGGAEGLVGHREGRWQTGLGSAASARRCRWAASESKAWVVAWLAASSLPSPVDAFVDNVAGTVSRHRHEGLEDTSRRGWDLPTSKQGRM